MSFKYNKLRGKIREIYNTQESFSSAMGISTVSLSAKLNNKNDWSQKEINKAAKLLNIPAKEISVYFFTQELR